ncbi:MAG: glycoside hydrolase family 140 protein [Trueperaceae bacterium]|nr:glycoside hydrolase family 140 protein [Trueperaceae bacterium]
MQLNTFQNKRGKLKVAANQRHLAFADDTPFFYLGDTAWELFHRLNLEEAKHYLGNRAAKGFTVIQAVVLAELGGLDVPNANGDLPLKDRDPGQPNEAYFQHVDDIVAYAENLGMFIGMLPTWGAYWKKDGRDSSIFTPENAFSYGRFLGERYRDSAIIWILGGDQDIENEEEAAIIEAMARGLKEGDGGTNLMTFHPRGTGRSADKLHHASWLDFNMCQSSHGARDHDNGLFIEQDYALEPVKPALDGEPRYETIPVGFYNKGYAQNERFDDYDVRQAAYWAVMAGACGHTYGHNCVWQMFSAKHQPAIWANIPWYASLDHPGAFQMGLLRRLFESRPFQDLQPANHLLLDAPRHGAAKVKAMLAKTGDFAFIYSARGESFTVDKSVFSAKRVKAIWFDPRYGCTYFFHTGSTVALQTFSPPSSGRGNDWVLILEDEQANYPLL